jgi:hypothetical protein
VAIGLAVTPTSVTPLPGSSSTADRLPYTGLGAIAGDVHPARSPSPDRRTVRRPHVRTRLIRAVHLIRPAAPFVAGPTGWSALNAAIARIPSYRPLGARWVVGDTGGSWWGTADWYDATIYINPSTPSSRLYDVAVHEWSHILSVRDYSGDVSAAVSAMNYYFGGTGNVGPERAADCMAILQGATWTHYTTCDWRDWRSYARQLLAGRRLSG